MRVLYIVTAYPRHSDDVITPWLVETIHRLRGAGVEVEVLAPSYRGLGGQVVAGVRVHRFRYAPRAWETLTHDQTAPDRVRERPRFLGLVPGYVAAGSVAAARLARSGRFDVVHAFWPIPHAVPGLAAARAAGLPLVLTFFGVELSWLRSDFPVLTPLLRRLVAGATAVTAISASTASGLRRAVPGAEPVVIPFGAAVELGEGEGAAARAGRREGPFRLLFVGRLVERKGVDVLLRAVRLLLPTREVALHVVGDGPMRAEWERLAGSLELGSVAHFEGLIPSERLASLLGSSDALVLPAVVDAKGDTEGLGVVLIEALRFGTPVIASDCGGIPDIVRHDETGLLVAPGDPPALAAAIERYMDDPSLAARHAAAGRAHVEAQFSWDAIIGRLAGLYRSVADAPQQRESMKPKRRSRG